MIDLTIVFSIVVAIAIYKVLEIFSDYLALKIHSYRFKKHLSKLEYKYESWLGSEWDEYNDDCDICDEMEEAVKKPVKKTAAKKKTR
jgi:hypothetical protein